MFETLDSTRAEKSGAEPPTGTLAPGKDPKAMLRAEVDTSAPFQSVREAVDRFGGSAVWKSQLKQLLVPEKHHCSEEVELSEVGQQTSKLEMDLIMKERETLDVLKELETTKRIVQGLKSKLQKATSETIKIPETNSDNLKVHPILGTEQCPWNPENHVEAVGPNTAAKQYPGLILMELKQAKLNLNRTTSDLAGIRASVELLKSKIEEEKLLLGKTRERLSSNTAKVSSLEEELNRTALELQRTKDAKCEKGFGNSSDISGQIKQLNSEKERYKKMTEAAESEVSVLIAEIEQTMASIKAAEIRCLAAKKMEEAAKVAEAIALTKIKALANSENSFGLQTPSEITIPIEEYDMLTRKAQEADGISRKKIEGAMLQVEEANRSKGDLLTKVEEATAEVETSRKALEEALSREESANRGKLAVETALRRWRSEQAQKRRSISNSTKFKNSYPVHHRRDSRMLDMNGLSLDSGGSRTPLGPVLSIGEILNRKLIGPEEYEAAIQEKMNRKVKVSLGQILSRRRNILSQQATDATAADCKQSSEKRKKFGIAGFSIQFAKQNKKSKKKKRRRPAWQTQVNCRPKLV